MFVRPAEVSAIGDSACEIAENLANATGEWFRELDDGGSAFGLRDATAACRAMAKALDIADTGLDTARTSVPAVWQGETEAEAVAALRATQQMMELAAPSMRSAASMLEDYADEVRRLSAELEVCNGLTRVWREKPQRDVGLVRLLVASGVHLDGVRYSILLPDRPPATEPGQSCVEQETPPESLAILGTPIRIDEYGPDPGAPKPDGYR